MNAGRALALAAAIAVLAPSSARAERTTIWARSRHPEAEKGLQLIAEAESLERKARHLTSQTHADTFLAKSLHARAAILLHEAGAATSPDLFLRYRLAALYEKEERHDLALPLLESVVRANPPAALSAAAWNSLGIVYAQVGRVEDEIAAYGHALAVQPIASERATLLANRAEALMRTGDVSAAVEGYRTALALLSADYMVRGTGSTTLWGLGVALDRSGDLASGLDAIRVARIYDPMDRNLEPDNGWFFSPSYDQHWYEALGYWQVARKTDAAAAVRVDSYGRAVASLEQFIASAARDDKWLELAHVRLRQCQAEGAAFTKRVRLHPEQPPPRRRPSGL